MTLLIATGLAIGFVAAGTMFGYVLRDSWLS
jgi:hypothetical protein